MTVAGPVYVTAALLPQPVEGVVYVLINSAMPGLVKIGMTTGDLAARLKQLDTTGVPLPFECVYAARVKDCAFVERRLHLVFGDHRLRQSREFFRLAPERVRAALELAQGVEVTPTADVAVSVEDQAALDKERKRASVFRFSLVGIGPGAELTSTFDPDRKAVVVDDRKVRLDGEEMSLSKAARLVGEAKGHNWVSWQGPYYWMYGDKTLVELREEAEFGEDQT